MRSTLARRLRITAGRDATAARGALGISRETCAAEASERRTATSMPPAETFSAVANSRDSFSPSAWLRTKTGMARGKRGHRLRSVPEDPLFADTHTSSWAVLPNNSSILWAKSEASGEFSKANPVEPEGTRSSSGAGGYKTVSRRSFWHFSGNSKGGWAGKTR